MYSLIRPFLFALEPELSHDHTLRFLAFVQKYNWFSRIFQSTWVDDPCSIAGLKFLNRVGLAAGLDKQALALGAFSAMGFGFIELGTVTPLPQKGQEKPRLFRSVNQSAIINRFGFNSVGVDQFLSNLQESKQYMPRTSLIGINIGKNAQTSIALSVNDYLLNLQKVYPFADYITLNISSPNTENLRTLQQGTELSSLLTNISEKRTELANTYQRKLPIFIKISPDLFPQDIQVIAEIIKGLVAPDATIEDADWGVIATNTTLSRMGVDNPQFAKEPGGLSGKPLKNLSTRVVMLLREYLGHQVPIIATGGIFSGEDAMEKLSAGANLVQIYSGFIFQGPRLVKQIATVCQRTYQV
ncbi:MAG: quinone-dependent dihydroorotate dehydrogenase [Gammaproteobacteria bacterium]|nr:quinone-dependent dihydroorotate dehydrogenase [Gammaproteobacteria bacterium]